MKIKLNIGCFGEKITIDNFPIKEITSIELSNICESLISKASDKEQLIEIVRMLLTEVGDYTSDEEPCSNCGTWGEIYEIEI